MLIVRQQGSKTLTLCHASLFRAFIVSLDRKGDRKPRTSPTGRCILVGRMDFGARPLDFRLCLCRLMSCMALVRLLNFSVLQCHHQQSSSIYLIELLCKLNKLILIKVPACFLVHSKGPLLAIFIVVIVNIKTTRFIKNAVQVPEKLRFALSPRRRIISSLMSTN